MRVTPKKEKIIEDGWYKAEIGDTEDKDTQFGEKLMVPFNVEADGDVVEITAFISYSDSPKSNMVKWATGLWGEGVFDTDDFAGTVCEVFVEEGEDKEGSPKNFVRKVRKAKGQTGKQKSPAKQEVEKQEENFDDIPI